MADRLLSRGLLLLILAAPAVAQFSQLTATDDGTQLYFTSQTLLKGEPPNPATPFPEARLFRAAAGNVTLFAERGGLAAEGTGSSSSGVLGPRVTGDGSLIAFSFVDVCPTDTKCISPGTLAEIRGTRTIELGPGTVQLSRNGRWALVTNLTETFTPPAPPVDTYTSTLIDLTTGARTDVPPPPFGVTQALASDGTLLVQPPSGPVSLWKQGQLSPIRFPSDLYFGVFGISDDASTLLLTGSLDNGGGIGLIALDLSSGTAKTVFQPQDAQHVAWPMSASRDGRFVLYRVLGLSGLTGPAYIADSATGKTVAIPLPDAEVVSDGTLTGSGDIAFLATTAGRIVKFTVATGTVVPLFSAVPHCDSPYPVAAGSLTTLNCNIAGSASELQGKILIDDVVVPVLQAQAGSLQVQIPWEASGFGDTITLHTPNDSPFEASQPIDAGLFAPGFFGAPSGQSGVLGLDFIKSDWSAVLTAPPGPGDIVYAYLTGLGPVRDRIATGAAASMTAPDPIVGTFTCQFAPQQMPAETLFAGLAPGTIGIYQVAFRMPADAGAPITGLSCRLSTPWGSAVFATAAQ